MEEAAFLLDPGGFGTAATYLAGYAIECALKALVLFSEPVARQRATLGSFRGVRAHDFDWLKAQLALRNCFTPREVALHLSNVAWWETDLRYDPRRIDSQDAEDFLNSAKAIVDWAKGRIGHG
jgi:hypothetical protein